MAVYLDHLCVYPEWKVNGIGCYRLEFDQTANLARKAEHDQLVADANAKPIPELEFVQTLGW